MLIAKVIGTTVSTIKDEKLEGRKLLILRQTDETGEPSGKPYVAVDTVDAGIGDLVLTCTGSLSRNRALGADIGSGLSLDEAMAGKETVAEGVITTRSAFALAQREGVEMPIVEAVYRTLFEGHPARQSITALMARELRPEQD